MNRIHFERWRTILGQYRWRLVAANGEKIAAGEGYWNRTDRDAAIVLIREAHDAPVLDL